MKFIRLPLTADPEKEFEPPNISSEAQLNSW